MKHFLVLFSLLLISLPSYSQTEKPQTIIVPTGSLGEISEARKKILEKTLESKLDDFFDIVPKDLFEEAQEKAFEELDYEECTEEQCIMMIKEILQVENSFQLVLISEEGDTQISLTWNDLDKKRVEEEYCEGCKTKELRKTIAGLVEKLVGVKKDDVVKKEPPKKVEPEVVVVPKQQPVVLPEKEKSSSLETVIDPSTGLMWQKKPDGVERNWEDAFSYCSNLSLAGYTDWVLPSRDVLKDMKGNKHLFDPFKRDKRYWSSTASGILTSYAWYVYSIGRVNNSSKVSSYYVRCVRGG